MMKSKKDMDALFNELLKKAAEWEAKSGSSEPKSSDGQETAGNSTDN